MNIYELLILPRAAILLMNVMVRLRLRSPPSMTVHTLLPPPPGHVEVTRRPIPNVLDIPNMWETPNAS